MGKLPHSDSNVLLALSSNNIPAHRAVPFICAHNNHWAGQEQRCWRCCPAAERAILQETCIPGKAGWAGTCLHCCCPHFIGHQTFVKRLFFGKCWGFLLLKCSVTTVHAWWWGMEILLKNWMCPKLYCQNKRKVWNGLQQFFFFNINRLQIMLLPTGLWALLLLVLFWGSIPCWFLNLCCT